MTGPRRIDTDFLALPRHALADAATTWEKLDAIDHGVDLESARSRVRFLVDVGAGDDAMRELTRLSRFRGLRRDAEVRFAMAENLLQQENYNRAFAMFGRARQLGGDDVRAWLGMALAQVYAARMNRATDALREAADASIPADAPEGAEPPARDMPRYLVVRGWIEANLGRFASAKTYAERALEADAGNTEAQVLLAKVATRSRQDPEPHWRAAIDGAPRRPLAEALLALRLRHLSAEAHRWRAMRELSLASEVSVVEARGVDAHQREGLGVPVERELARLAVEHVVAVGRVDDVGLLRRHVDVALQQVDQLLQGLRFAAVVDQQQAFLRRPGSGAVQVGTP